MKTTKFLTLIMLLGMALALVSCSKGDKGDTGPQGPAGTNGTNGVANISTGTVTINPGNWSSGGGYYYASFSDANITDVALDGVLVSYSFSGTTWDALPSADVFTGSDQMGFMISTGTVQLWYQTTTAPSSSIEIKVTVIPPAMIKQHPISYWSEMSNQ